ncbi:sigma-54 dependent transcriptional regulator [Chitinophaga sp. YIM B06452]|uniref:sigma-54-dependent transcriptional regulator n=1 Tax=Chitinophaga sp. YIM B06452 TaxID=3082158 RepID=UPI0031FF15BD
MKKLLIVEDEFIEAKNLERILVKAGYAVCGTARSVDAALAIVSEEQPDFVLIDIFLKGPQTGIDLAMALRRKQIPFLYVSANSDPSTLDAAKKTAPYGFLLKPFRERDVLVMLEIAIYQYEYGLEAMMRKQPASGHSARPDGNASNPPAGIIGKNPSLLQVMEHVRIVSPSATSVLILGESGTGKERIAQALHEMSPRKAHPFVKVNCAALPITLIESILFGHEKGAFTDAVSRVTGKFEQAEKGTLFLDEIGELPVSVQVKLLRALQEKEIERIGGKQVMKVDVRIVAATNRDLEKEVAAGRFRLDLYYRLNVFPIHIPPLRQRKDDILLLARHFIELFCNQEGRAPFSLPPGLCGKLQDYHWPGNIRELENAVRRMVLLGPDLPDASVYFGERAHAMPGQAPFAENQDVKTWQSYEREYILYTLRKCKGKISGKSGAAELLDLAPSTLESKMKRLGIRKHDYTNKE